MNSGSFLVFAPSPPFALRNFVINHYKELKGANPSLPILVRECAGVEPKLWARFGALVLRVVCIAGPL